MVRRTEHDNDKITSGLSGFPEGKSQPRLDLRSGPIGSRGAAAGAGGGPATGGGGRRDPARARAEAVVGDEGRRAGLAVERGGSGEAGRRAARRRRARRGRRRSSAVARGAEE